MKNTRKPGEGGRKPFQRDGKPAGRDGDKPFRSEGKPFRADGKPGDKSGKPAMRKTFSAKPREAREKNPDHIAVTGEGERISKIMARVGVASRRDCERMILEGRVRLNGKVLDTPAINCTPADVIEVDGEPINAIERTRLWIYYKPAGLVTTNHDPEGRPTVFDNLPEELPRVISVGRLDINTEGLLLLTNDGGLARMLELPTTGWLRRYRVRAHGSIDQARLDELKEGIAVDGIFYGAIEATLDREQGHNVWITMGLREGKNREIKNVLGALGLDVNRLIRISYGPFQLGELEDGQVVEVKSRTLRDQLGPRLIAEANANFDAPIHDPVQKDEDEVPAKREWSAGQREERSERATSRVDTKRGERPERSERPARGDRPERGERPAFGDRPDRGERPARAGRPERSERPDRGDRPARGERPPRSRERDGDGDRRGAAPHGRDRDGEDKRPKRPPLGSIRTANVWMAPGARPVAVKKGKDETIDTRTGDAKPKRRLIRLRKDGADVVASAPAKEGRIKRPARPAREGRPEDSQRPERRERPAGRPPVARRDEAGAEGGRARPERSFAARRSEDGSPERKPRGDKPPFGDRKSEGEARPGRNFAGKPERSGKPERKGPGDGPRAAGPRSDKPRGDWPKTAGPREDGPRGDGPRKGGPGGKGMRSGADRRR